MTSPAFPGLERRAVVTLYQCEGLHLFEVEQRNERGLEPDGALMRRVSSRDSTCFHG
jgi:hypothetical protein